MSWIYYTLLLDAICGVCAIVSRYSCRCKFPFPTLQKLALSALITTYAFHVLVPLDGPTYGSTEKYSLERMLLVGAVWFHGIRGLSLVWCPTSVGMTLPWYRYVASEMLWYLIPLNKMPSDAGIRLKPRFLESYRPFLAAYIRFTLWYVPLIASKAALGEFLWLYLRKCTSEERAPQIYGNYGLLTFYTTLFGFSVFSNLYFQDVLRLFIILFTGGRFDYLLWNNWFILSSSVEDFWAWRYNKPVHVCLKDSVYKPLRIAGSSREMATLAAFAVSGLVHAHIIHAVCRERQLPAFLFFVLQTIPIFCADTEPEARRIDKKKKEKKRADFWDAVLPAHHNQPSPIPYSFVGNVSTISFLISTAPLYLGSLAVRSYTFDDEPTPFIRPIFDSVVDDMKCYGF